MHNPVYDTRPMRFFFLQAVAITFEDAVIGLAARAGLKNGNLSTRIIGYIWVYSWFVFSIPIWVDSLNAWGPYGLLHFKFLVKSSTVA
jgi:hypothetical protein